MKMLDADLIVVIGLVISLWSAIYGNMGDLANYIVAGLIGYIGRGKITKGDNQS